MHRRGRDAEARALLDAALLTDERTLGPKHPRVAEVLVELAELDLAAGDVDRGLARLERAAAIVDAADIRPEERARILFVLARALVERGRDLARADALIARATDLSEGSGPGGATVRAEIAAWKLVRPPAP